jgi:hypothetical protein
MPDALATTDDLAVRLGRTYTGTEEDKAEALLRDASAAVRSYTGQTFSLVTDDTVRLRPRNGTLRLPQRPVVAVSAVANVDGDTVSFTWDNGQTVYLAGYGYGLNAFEVEPFRSRLPWLDVTYTHGYETIPDDIVAVVANIAGRAFGRQLEDAGLQSETIAGYSYSLGAAGAAGGVGMLNDERAVLDRYRIVGGTARLAG